MAALLLSSESLQTLEHSNPKTYQRIKRLATPRMTPYIPTSPTIKQAAFLLTDQRDVFFGGAAGGGKSESLLMAALQYVDVPGYNAIILRRTFRDLDQPEAIMNRARSWLINTDARWNDNKKRWTFPSGATLTFGYLEKQWDHLQYQGAEFQFVGFDELTQFMEYQFLYLFSRLRRKRGVKVPLRIRSASNPGGPGHEWVKARYITGKEAGRVFIPSTLTDNPFLDHEEYLQSLAQLDHVTRAQLLGGDWDASFDGGVFKRHWFEVVPEIDLTGAKFVRYWDLASTEPHAANPDPDYTAGVLLAMLPNYFVVLDVQRDRLTPGKVEQLIKTTAAADRARYGAVAVRIEQEGGASGKALIARYVQALRGFDVRGRAPGGDKLNRAKPVSAQAEYGFIKLLEGGWNHEFLNEVVWFNPSHMNRHDDQVDAFTGAYDALVNPEPSNKAKRAPAAGLYASRSRRK